MKKFYQLFFAAVLLLCSINKSMAQLTGGNIFLPGRYLEIGQNSYGAFGAAPAPAIYHPYGYELAEVYDYGHDGWTVGSPPLMGDYTYPGSPFEGWGIQVGSSSQLNWAFTSSGSITGTGSLTGSNVSYSTAGGHCIGNWQGTCGPSGVLHIKSETRVDTNASWVVMTTKMYNTGTTTLNNIYYMRTCDPDNDEAHGGSFSTYNKVIYQNDAIHRVMVKGSGETYTYAYLGLCSKDQRSKALVYSSWPINYYVTDLSTVYSGTASIAPDYTVGLADDGDIATGIVFYICSIPANDSAVISCAYTFLNSDHGVDSAFPEPAMVLDSVLTLPPSPGAALYDTFFSCSHPGMTVVPVDLSGATSGVWTWSSWTWSPAIGLSASTGTSVSITLALLSGATTYTITGIDSLPGSSCAPGNRRVMYLTVVPCFGAIANSPCIGDPLYLNAIGDSTSATYQWINPAGTIVSTLHHLTFTTSVWADTGTWSVIRTETGTSTTVDTATVHVVIHPLPTFTLSCNGDSLCSSSSLMLSDTMKLYCLPYTAGDHYLWTGPNGFMSNIEFPYTSPYIPIDTGWYHLTITDTFGCMNTDSVFARIIPPIIAPTITGVHHYCTGGTFVPFGIILMTGASALWYTDSVGGTGSSTAPYIDVSFAHIVTVYASQYEGACEGLRGSFTVVVDSTPAPSVLSSNSPLCADSILQLIATNGLGGGSFSWSGPNAFTSMLQNPVIHNAQNINSGTYTLVYTMPSTCFSTASTNVIVNPTPAPPVLTADTPCDGFTLNLYATGTYGSTFSWSGPAGFYAATAITSVNPAVLGVNDGVYTVVAALAGTGGSCLSSPSTILTHIWANPDTPITHDTAYCQFYLHPMLLEAEMDIATGNNNYLTWYTSSTGAAGTVWPSSVQPPTGTPGTTPYYVQQKTVHSSTTCYSPIGVENIHVLDSPIFKIWQSSTFACQDSSLVLKYFGPYYYGLKYAWALPVGASFVDGSTWDSSQVRIKFDSLYHDTVALYVTDNRWNISCASNNIVNIKVVPMPTVHCFINPIVCAGDTINIELTDRSDNAFTFDWNFDFWGNDGVITSTSGTTGPFDVQWVEGGTRIVTVIPLTEEGCVGLPVNDTVLVRNRPDASFNHRQGGLVCALDSVLFIADLGDSANYSYKWNPSHFFNENNKGNIWGRIEISGYVTLTVTDPFKCVSSDSLLFETDPTCCIVSFPGAFTPNGDGKNDDFRPIYAGHHKFHIFKVQNRWGQTVFETTGNDNAWDGTFNGIPQDIGVYYYYLKFDCDGKTIEKRGDLTLLR